jgi:TetR/AcrR family transcriptional repressor of nem operon
MLTTADHLPRTKDPEATRARLLECAFEEIYRHGYGGASVDRILSQTGLTKGALYHHFGSKADLAYAVIEEVIGGKLDQLWVAPLRESDDPLGALTDLLGGYMTGEASMIDLERGCPLNNLTQELANADEEFRTRLLHVHEAWRNGIATALERGQAAGTVRDDVEPSATATFIVSAIEGLAGTAKSTRDLPLVLAAGGVLVQFLESLRPAPTTRRRPRPKRH